MVTKIYALAWLLLIAAGGVLHFTGNINDLTITVIGFMLATLAFMGIVLVLPWWVDRKYSWKYAKSDSPITGMTPARIARDRQTRLIPRLAVS